MIGLDERLFQITLEMAAAGLAADKKRGARHFAVLVERFRSTLLGDTDARIPPAIDANDDERRARAGALADLLARHRRGAEIAEAMARPKNAAITAELWARRRGTTIARLHAAGRIDDRQLWAANEIAEAADGFMASACGSASGLLAQTLNGGGVPGRTAPGAYVDVMAFVERYRGWCGGVMAKGWPLRAVLDVAVAGQPLRETERHWQMRNGTLIDVVRDSLDLYLEMVAAGH